MSKTNRQWLLASRPSGAPSIENFQFNESPVPTLDAGQVLVRNHYISVDPYIRGRMRNVRSYVPPLEVGNVVESGASGRVEASNDPRFQVGDLVLTYGGWQDYTIANADTLQKLPSDPSLLPLSLGILGMPGMTAYFALLDVGQPKAGETVLISGAAGAVGSTVGQIAKIKGCRAVGICGSDDKGKWLVEELGFDAYINYKTQTNIRRAIRQACPNGVDVYFDNVGGEISDAAITVINMKARVIICGQISTINREKTEMGPRTAPLYLLINRARMEGFLVHDYKHRYPEAAKEMLGWMKEGKLKSKETIVEGFEKTPEAFAGLFRGDNTGKMLVKIST